jgi:hypothetical protein
VKRVLIVLALVLTLAALVATMSDGHSKRVAGWTWDGSPVRASVVPENGGPCYQPGAGTWMFGHYYICTSYGGGGSLPAYWKFIY